MISVCGWELACFLAIRVDKSIVFNASYINFVIVTATPLTCVTHTLRHTTCCSYTETWDTCRVAARNSCYCLEVQHTSVQKTDPSSLPVLVPVQSWNHLLSLPSQNHYPAYSTWTPVHHSMREEILSNILVEPTFNQLQWMSPSSSCCINLKHIC